MSKRDLTAMLKRWQQPGSAGFFNFLDDAKPMIPSEKGGFQPYTLPSDRVRDEIARALDGQHSTLIFCWPRRHGKTVVVALLIAWRFLTRRNQMMALVANSHLQTVDTAFRLVRTILEQTPYTRSLIDQGAISIGRDFITYEALSNEIRGFPSNLASLYGKKLAVAQVSELHAARTDEIYQVLASSIIDTADGVVLVDSTVGPKSSPLYALYRLWETGADPAIYFSHISYRDLDDALTNGPAWIDPRKLKSRAAQMLPALFEAQHLNNWGSSQNALFPADVLKRCTREYPLDAKALAAGKAHVVGGGLDRSMLFSVNGDRTVLASVVKMAGEDDEPEYWVLSAKNFLISTDNAIKREVKKLQREQGLTHLVVEKFEGQDLVHWAAGQGLKAEIQHATTATQQIAFLALSTAAREGRLHIHPCFEDLLQELADFEYTLEGRGHSSGLVASFSHPKGGHDDFVYALAWAVFSLREEELNPWEMHGIHCDAHASVARLCLLNDGEIVPACAESCRSFQQLSAYYNQYRSKPRGDPMSIGAFFASKVKNVGSHSVRR